MSSLMKKLEVKVCGMADASNVHALAQLSIDYLGFIFHRPSPRNAFSLPVKVITSLPANVTPVGVFVNPPTDEIVTILRDRGINTVQLHGSESPEQCFELARLGFNVWKAVGIDEHIDWIALSRYDGAIDRFVFDTKSSLWGGTGSKYDWDLLHTYKLATPFMLSGGITPSDAASIRNLSHSKLIGVDLNSRFELRPGVKDTTVLIDFIDQLNQKL